MKNKKRTLQRKADRAFQIWFVSMNLFCEMCGNPTSCGHHVFPKSSSSALRYVVANMCAVCASCHLKFHSKFSSEMIIRLTLKRGNDWYKELKKEKVKIIKPTIKYYEDIIKKYENT